MHHLSLPVPRRLRSGGRRRDDGQMFVMVAASLAVLLGFSAMAVDVGSYAVDRRNLQNAADAAALAAATELPDSNAAQAAALDYAEKNQVPASDVTVTVVQQSLPSVPNPYVQVSVRRSHTFFFGRAVGIGSQYARASAKAIKTSPGGDNGLMPWTVNEATLNQTQPGQQAILKYDSNGVHSGNFGALAIDGTGASVYRTTIINGSQNTVCVTGLTDCSGVTVETEPGNMIGPTREGVNARMAATDSHCDTFGEVFTPVAGQTGTYSLNRSCNPWLSGGYASKRVILIPITSGEYNGRKPVTITGFALFFLEGFQNGVCQGNDCNVMGRFVRADLNIGSLKGVFNPNSMLHFVRLDS